MVARLGVALALVLAACTDDSDSAPTAVPVTSPPASSTVAPPATPPATATTVALPVSDGELGALDAALGDDGTVTLQGALALFAAGYAPLPGVQPAPRPLVDGGPVLRRLLADGDRLGDEQRAALVRAIGPPGTAIADVVDDATSSTRLLAAADVVTTSLRRFEALLNLPLPDGVAVTLVELPYDAGDGTHHFSDPQEHASAVSLGDGSVAYAECRLRINASSAVDPTAGFADPAFASALAAESFHCLQAAESERLADVPVWIVEGAAAFAGESTVGGSGRSASWWQRWLEQPQRPLERRTADAIGFFALLAEITEPYQVARALLHDPGSTRWRTESSPLFDRWGAHAAGEPTWGPDFAFAGPGLVPTPVPQLSLTLPIDGPAVAAAPPAAGALAAAPYRLQVPGDVVVITTTPGDRGAMRWSDGQVLELATPSTQTYCLLPEGCVCPGSTAEASPATAVAGRDLFVGVGPSAGGGPQLAARSLARWCQDLEVPVPPAGAVDACLARRWTSTGYLDRPTPGVATAVSGGDGAVLQLDPDRTARVELAAMAPVVIAGPTSTTTLAYEGAGEGTWSAESGAIDVSGVDPGSFVVRVTIETPGDGLIYDERLAASDLRLATYAGVLGAGRYECTPVSMQLTRSASGLDGEVGLTFAPAG